MFAQVLTLQHLGNKLKLVERVRFGPLLRAGPKVGAPPELASPIDSHSGRSALFLKCRNMPWPCH